MPDASTIDTATVLQLFEKIEQHGQSKLNGYWVHVQASDYLLLKEFFRTALADTRRVDYIQALAPEQFWGCYRHPGKGFKLRAGPLGFRLVRDAIDAAIGQDLLDADDAAMAATPRDV